MKISIIFLKRGCRKKLILLQVRHTKRNVGNYNNRRNDTAKQTLTDDTSLTNGMGSFSKGIVIRNGFKLPSPSHRFFIEMETKYRSEFTRCCRGRSIYRKALSDEHDKAFGLMSVPAFSGVSRVCTCVRVGESSSSTAVRFSSVQFS